MSDNGQLFSKIWKSCNQLRGRFDPSEYKYVILTIIFLKFASENYKKRIDEISKENISIDDNLGKDIIIIPEGCHWDDIKSAPVDKIHYYIDGILKKIIKENNKLNLNGLWIKFGEKFKNNPSSLKNIIDYFTHEKFERSVEENRDLLGNCYEYFLKQFGKDSGKKSGEFYTPKSIVKLIAEILTTDLKNLKLNKTFNIYDPTVGSGGMFIQSAKILKNNYSNLRFFGQEINDNTYTLAIMNLAIRGLDFDLGGEANDTLKKDLHINQKADIVIANPPFNLVVDKTELSNDVKRWKYGIPNDNKGNYFFMQHMINKMKEEKSILGVVLDNGSQTSNATKHIRENILKDDLYEAVIELPENIFYGTNIPATLYILRKGKSNKTKDKVLLVDSKNNYTKNGKINELSEDNINKILEVYKNFLKGDNVDTIGLSTTVDKDEIIKNNSILSPRQYIKQQKENINYKKEYIDSLNELENDILEIKLELEDLLKIINKNKGYVYE